MGLGAYGGLNLANYSLDAEELSALSQTNTRKEAKNSYLLGAYIDFDVYLSKSSLWGLSIQSDILYTVKGAKYLTRYQAGGSQEDLSSDFFFNYIELPLLFKFKYFFSGSSPVTLYGLGGMSLALLHKATEISRNIFNLTQTEREITERFRTVDANFIWGLGASSKISKTLEIFGEFRYAFGLLNSYKETVSNESLIHVNLYFMFGIGLRL